jgi:hypothetical protein
MRVPSPTLILNLQKEIVFAEDIAIEHAAARAASYFSFHQSFRDFAFKAARQADQSFGVLRQKFLAHARLVIKAVQRGLRRDLHQVAIAFFVFRQHQQMVVGVAVGRRALDVVIVLLADVELAADDGLDARLLAAFTKCTAPKILPWSVMATAGMPSSFARSQSLSTSQAPSSIG